MILIPAREDLYTNTLPTNVLSTNTTCNSERIYFLNICKKLHSTFSACPDVPRKSWSLGLNRCLII